MITRWALMDQRKASGGEWPRMRGFEDKRNLRALNVRFDRNSGLPTSREAQGNGASIVLLVFTPYHGTWESQVYVKGRQASQRVKEGVQARDANHQHHPGTHSG